MESQQSKRGRKEGQEIRLGDLPNDLLRSILHNLPLKEAVRTSGISHLWEIMWLDAIATSQILDFTDRDFVRQAPAQVAATVSLCLKRHADQGAPLDTLRVAMDGTLGGAKAFGHDVVGWVVDAVARGARELEVHLTPKRGDRAAQQHDAAVREGLFVELPGDLFLARNSLVRLAAAGLAGLRSLSLSHANVTDEEVEAALSSCLMLEFLSLRSCHLLESVRIVGDKLRCLELVSCLAMRELRVAARALESFGFYGDIVCSTDDGNNNAAVDLGTMPALQDAYLSHIGFTDLYFLDRETAAYSGFLSCLAHARTLTLCSIGLLMLAQDRSDPNLGTDMTKVQELQLLMEFLGFADIQSTASLFLHNPLPLLDRLFIHLLGDPTEEGRKEPALTGELVDDRDIFIYGEDIVLGQLKLIKVVNLRGTRLEFVLLAFLVKRAPALEQLVLVMVEEEQGGPGDELVKIIQGHVSAMQKASPFSTITVCRASEDESPNPVHTRFYHEY